MVDNKGLNHKQQKDDKLTSKLHYPIIDFSWWLLGEPYNSERKAIQQEDNQHPHQVPNFNKTPKIIHTVYFHVYLGYSNLCDLQLIIDMFWLLKLLPLELAILQHFV